MLVICNGAFKSGSTWLFETVRTLTGFGPVPEQYLKSRSTLPDWRENPQGEVWAIALEVVRQMLDAEDLKGHDYLSKNHISTPKIRDVILANEDVRVIDICRDLRDVVVSAYYHDKDVHKLRGDFRAYYWSLGRVRADAVRRHNKVWSIPSPRIYVSAYERLKQDYVAEVTAIGGFLGVAVDGAILDRLAEETSIRKMRKKWGEKGRGAKFFRKGNIGDWQQHFDDDISEDMERIVRHGLDPISRGASVARALPLLSLPHAYQKLKARLKRGRP